MLSKATFTDSIRVEAALPNLDVIIRGLLYVYIFSLSFKQLLVVERTGFILLIVLLVLWCAVNRRHFFQRTPIDLPLIVFIAWVGVTVPFAAFPAYSFSEFAKLLQQGLIFYMVVYFFRGEVHRQRLMSLLLSLLATVSIYGIWQFETKPWHGVPQEVSGRTYYFIESFLHGDVALSTYLVILTPLSAAVTLYWEGTWKKLMAGGTTGLAVLCQMLTLSRGGALALIAEAAAFVWGSRQRKLAYLVGALALVLVFVMGGLAIVSMMSPELLPAFLPGPDKFNAYNVLARLDIWTFGLTKLMEHPLVGIGFGKNNFYIATGEESRHLSSALGRVLPAGTHNTFLDVAVGAGIPAVLAFVWLLGAMVRAGIEQLQKGEGPQRQVLPLALIVMVVGMSIRNFFDHMWVGTLAVQFWVLVGLCMQPLAADRSEKGLEEQACPIKSH